jgi:hypothetical protein
MATFSRLLFVSMIALFSAMGASSRTDIARPALPERFALPPEFRPQYSALPRPSPPTQEFNKEKMLAWILLSIKAGPGAR